MRVAATAAILEHEKANAACLVEIAARSWLVSSLVDGGDWLPGFAMLEQRNHCTVFKMIAQQVPWNSELWLIT